MFRYGNLVYILYIWRKILGNREEREKLFQNSGKYAYSTQNASVMLDIACGLFVVLTFHLVYHTYLFLFHVFQYLWVVMTDLQSFTTIIWYHNPKD